LSACAALCDEGLYEVGDGNLYKRMIYMCMFIGELVLLNVQSG